MTPGRDRIAELKARLAELELASDDALAYSDERREAVLRSRARSLAAPAEDVDTAPAGEAMVLFVIAQERYALPMRCVREVSLVPELTRVPGVPAYFVGVCHHRGEIVAVVDLHELFRLAPEPSSPAARLLFIGEDHVEMALRVDTVQGQAQIDIHSLQDVHHPDSVTRDYVRGVTADAVIVLDGAALLDDPRLYVEEEPDFKES